MLISKSEARKNMKQYRNSLAPEVISDLSRGICDNLSDCGIIDDSVRYVLSFASYKSEPDTRMIDTMIRERYPDIKIAYPKVTVHRESCNTPHETCDNTYNIFVNDMEFYVVNSFDELICGYMNIPEPDPVNTDLLAVEKINSINEQVRIIVPGLAYDMSGKRAGYGGGFYDRYMKRIDGVKRIGICFDQQLMRDTYIQCDEYDIGVDVVVTDERVVYI